LKHNTFTAVGSKYDINANDGPTFIKASIWNSFASSLSMLFWFDVDSMFYCVSVYFSLDFTMYLVALLA